VQHPSNGAHVREETHLQMFQAQVECDKLLQHVQILGTIFFPSERVIHRTATATAYTTTPMSNAILGCLRTIGVMPIRHGFTSTPPTRQMSATLSPEEVAFLAEDALITITPNFDLDLISLISVRHGCVDLVCSD